MIHIKNARLSSLDKINLQSNQLAVWWLGQAGFLCSSRTYRFIIDPYLSDSLAIKYRTSELKHIRLMPIPVKPSQLKGINWIFSTHEHSDHMDIGTLPDLISSNQESEFYAPWAAEEKVFNFLQIDRRITNLVDRNDHIQLSSSISVDVIAAAHEELQFDKFGHSVFLGYIFTINNIRIYHSGDCIPYDGLADKLLSYNINIALLPVNGRDKYRKSRGIRGNFHFEEAVELCRIANIETLIPHHFGMFEFNSPAIGNLKRKIEALNVDMNIILPEINKAIIFITDMEIL
jgi:L-ascorbate metabolism protein UlaG (beta-lactamase superfamily)